MKTATVIMVDAFETLMVQGSKYTVNGRLGIDWLVQDLGLALRSDECKSVWDFQASSLWLLSFPLR